jgi:hypothetical protein
MGDWEENINGNRAANGFPVTTRVLTDDKYSSNLTLGWLH